MRWKCIASTVNSCFPRRNTCEHLRTMYRLLLKGARNHCCWHHTSWLFPFYCNMYSTQTCISIMFVDVFIARAEDAKPASTTTGDWIATFQCPWAQFPLGQRELQLQRRSEAKNEVRSKAKCWDVAGCCTLLDTMLSAESEFDSDLWGKLNGMACWDWPFAALKSGCWWASYFSRIIAEKRLDWCPHKKKNHEQTHTDAPLSKHRYGSELQSHLLYFDFDEVKDCFQAVAFIKPSRISWTTWASFSLETTAGITVAWC